MGDNTSIHDDRREIKLNPPKPFTGDRSKLLKFVYDCTLHLTLNQKIYDNDLKKISFVLSFMEGEAAIWKERFMAEAMRKMEKGENLDLGTWKEFTEAVNASFSPYDALGDALEEMKTLCLKTDGSIDEHIAKFKILVNKSQIERESAVMVDLFRETLTPTLQRRILMLEVPPRDLKGWYDWASRLDNQFKRAQRIMGQTAQNYGKRDEKKKEEKRWTFPRKQERDPNAMDVDSLSTQERTKLMKKGACFNCKKHGHLARDCPDKAGMKKTEEKKEEPKKKWIGKDAHAHVKSIVAGMDEEERKKFFAQAEEEGF
jgi:Ty3 transposon capsid-like protein/Zinc knuckle